MHKHFQYLCITEFINCRPIKRHPKLHPLYAFRISKLHPLHAFWISSYLVWPVPMQYVTSQWVMKCGVSSNSTCVNNPLYDCNRILYAWNCKLMQLAKSVGTPCRVWLRKRRQQLLMVFMRVMQWLCKVRFAVKERLNGFPPQNVLLYSKNSIETGISIAFDRCQ